ncbi:MAG: hypothetical protein QQN55_07440 [Nitrosopumilus sp.]
MKTHYIKENESVSSCGTVTKFGYVTTNEDEVECKSCLNILGNPPQPDFSPSDEVGPYYWGTCGVKVKFCMAVLSDFMTDAEKKRINKKIAHWYNRFGANIIDEHGKKF